MNWKIGMVIKMERHEDSIKLDELVDEAKGIIEEIENFGMGDSHNLYEFVNRLSKYRDG